LRIAMMAQDITTIEPARFEFGRNWALFLELLDDNRIRQAEESLRDMLEVANLNGKAFLDIGSGSGLFSLAARRLGARVHSFDYDPHSVACTAELRRRYFPDDARWTVEQGSALDPAYLSGLGTFDFVYSWGVLHHTGNMWQALDNVDRLVAPGGKLTLAIYNDAGGRSIIWRALKRTYLLLPRPLRPAFAALAVLPGELRSAASAVAKLRPSEYIHMWTRYAEQKRGMSRWRDMIDWVGGYPYEFARVDAVFDFYRSRGYRMTRVRCSAGPLGCNEFVFERAATPDRAGRAS
jgi:2-polyprenyl-6-hydroxyphenyl methylase/3-demethylubiquinone-9 3-methyltransferase